MSWDQLLAIFDEQAQDEIQARHDLAHPVACPNDGEPLVTGPDAVLFCRFDGWRAV